MLTVSSLNQYYGGSHILRNLSFEAPAGKVTALLGRNGVGKSTLLRTLMGLVPARAGRLSFKAKNITAVKPYERVRAGIGYVPQGTRNISAADRRGKPADGTCQRARAARAFRSGSLRCSRYCAACCGGAAAICRAGSSNNSRSAARSRSARGC